MALSYKELTSILDSLEKISSKIEKTQVLIDILKKEDKENIEYAVLFLLGRLYPEHVSKELGISTNLLIRALSKAYGYKENDIEEMWKNTGDLGKIAYEISKKRKQVSLLSATLSLREIINTLRQCADLEGEGSIDKKITLVSGLLMRAQGFEAKYLVRYILGDMRLGVAEGIMRDAIVGAFFAQFYWVSLLESPQGGINEDIVLKYWKNKVFLVSKEAKVGTPMIGVINKIASKIHEMPEEEIAKKDSFHYLSEGIDIVIVSSNEVGSALREKYTSMVDEGYALINDFPMIARISYEKGEEGLKNIKPVIFRPLRVMLAQKVESIKEAFQVVGMPAAFEYKFDGFRCQIHKKGNKIEIFTRRLENVTKQFPDLVEYIREHITAPECIIEGEAIGYDKNTKEWLPFQKISRRIRRKYDIEVMAKEIPVMIHLFDIVYLNGEKTTSLPFKDRRALLSKIVNEENFKVVLAKQIITSDEKEAERFYREALDLGNEGVMAKNLNAPYKAGLRVGYMLKIKPTMETLDLVIVGAEWGEGKRTGYLSSYELACFDPDTGEYLTIGKLGTGIKEKSESGGVSLEELTKMLKPHIIEEKGRVVKISPAVVVEVAYEEIQKSPHYTSGFALRFPRLIRVRDDKSPHEADTIERVYNLYEKQHHKGASPA